MLFSFYFFFWFFAPRFACESVTVTLVVFFPLSLSVYLTLLRSLYAICGSALSQYSLLLLLLLDWGTE